MNIRLIRDTDAEIVSAYLARLAQLGKRTLPHDPAFVRRQYISNPDIVQCVVAENDAGKVVGHQVLKRADPGNDYGVTPGWGMIGTHVDPDAARQGIGRKLFAATHRAARAAGLDVIDATIATENVDGQAYYTAIGFRDYRTEPGKICKRFDTFSG